MRILYFIIFILIVVFALWLFNKVKMPKVNSFCLVTGGVKAGKSTFCNALAISNYKRTLRKWKVKSFVCKILRKDIPEKPLLYSNIPLAGIDYVPLTQDIILRNKRLAYKSVCIINEASLVADSMSFGRPEIDENLSIFVKLFGHETHGGMLCTDSQAVADLHYGFRRNVTQDFYVHDMIKIFPFFLIAHVIEERYSDDGNGTIFDGDIEDNVKTVFISKKVWKHFDCYCYSKFTDDLPVEDNTCNLPYGADLRTDNIVSFKKYKYLKKELKDETNKPKILH